MTDLAALKRHIHDRLHAVMAGAPVAEAYHPHADWRAFHPVDDIQGIEAIAGVWDQLRTALPDGERRDWLFLAGVGEGDDRSPQAEEGATLIATLGVYQGTFRRDLFGIPATRGVVHLRACEVHRVVAGKIERSYVLWDLLDLMRQAGVWPLVTPLGAEGQWMPPATADGVRLDRHDGPAGAEALQRIHAMHNALFDFDGRDVETMPLARHWHESFMYYAAAGIGSTRGLAGFRAHHQIPFLRAFPDRRGGGHFVRIGDGDYAVTGGWPSVLVTHTGGEWLGVPATGKAIGMRVMDFYRLSEGRIAENWVPIDIIDALRQLGYDVFARLRHWRGDHPTNL